MPSMPLPAIALATALMGTALAHAQGPQGDEPSARWGVGIGVGSKQKPYAGIERDNEVLPLLEFENRYVHVLGPALELKLPSHVISETQRLNFRLIARYAIFGGYEAHDADILNGMAERKDGFWAGAKAEWKNSVVNLAALWLHDVSNYSGGQRFALGLERNWRVGPQALLGPRVAAIWQDHRYNDFYFGVNDSEAAPGRPAYRAESGVNLEAGLRGIFMFDRHHSVMLDLSVTSLSSQVKNSPLVDRASENRALLAYVYRF
jgi:outer membrane protein